jgi:predicted RNA-binding protein with PUA-like domain
MPQYWLFKSEPNSFSIDDLAGSPGKKTCWEGVRNYQARNYLRAMNRGDQGLFYHSNADPPAIVGVVEVIKQAYPDHYAFDQKSRYFDPKSTSKSPTWFMVDIRLIHKFAEPLSLEALRKMRGLEKMELLRKGSRLSVQPVREQEWKIIMEKRKKTRN